MLLATHRFPQCSGRSPASRWGSWLGLVAATLLSRSRWCHGLLRLLGLAVNLLLYSMLALRRRSVLRFGVSHGGASGGAMGHKDARAPLGQGIHPRRAPQAWATQEHNKAPRSLTVKPSTTCKALGQPFKELSQTYCNNKHNPQETINQP